ncbi:MAG: RraA family protein [Proteobacteria bacterium]|nr:MAG: RraA family protein [Pseudomonadota bacterium]
MNHSEAFLNLSPTTIADVMSRDRIMDFNIHPLWIGMPRIAGPAYPVRCGPGDNLMLHAAIYRAPPGSIIVCEAGDMEYAVAGGNVCAIAQKRGIAGFVVDGLLRDIAETRANHFPVFGRGLIPIPGTKEAIAVLNGSVNCGGVRVEPGDMIVADEEGIIVIPVARIDEVLKAALARAEKDSMTSLEAWEAAHSAKVEEAMRTKGHGDSEFIRP